MTGVRFTQLVLYAPNQGNTEEVLTYYITRDYKRLVRIQRVDDISILSALFSHI